MSDDDIRAPLAWIYDGTHPDSHIAGLFYMSAAENPAGFAGPNDTWHVHHNICIKTGAERRGRRAARRRPRRDAGAVRRGRRQPAAADAVPAAHVGRARLREPRRRVLAPHSAVTCDDGTYNTIADVTKVGTATTMCIDGTE